MERRLSFYSLLRGFSRKRKYQEEFDELRFGEDDTNDDAVAILSQAMIELVDSNKPRKHSRLPNKDRDELKMFWANGTFTGLMKNLKSVYELIAEALNISLLPLDP